MVLISVADPDPFDPDPSFHFDTNLDPAFHFDMDPDHAFPLIRRDPDPAFHFDGSGPCFSI
jgi:hypothetical protein